MDQRIAMHQDLPFFEGRISLAEMVLGEFEAVRVRLMFSRVPKGQHYGQLRDLLVKRGKEFDVAKPVESRPPVNNYSLRSEIFACDMRAIRYYGARVYAASVRE